MSPDRLRTEEVEELLRAFLALESPDEVWAFLQDVATIREVHDMAQRLAVARMLADGEHYTHIQEITGASTTTISRVSRSLNYGADGYTTIIDRFDATGEADARSGKAGE
jgi:TrpR-related protein YerC/YecD